MISILCLLLFAGGAAAVIALLKEKNKAGDLKSNYQLILLERDGVRALLEHKCTSLSDELSTLKQYFSDKQAECYDLARKLGEQVITTEAKVGEKNLWEEHAKRLLEEKKQIENARDLLAENLRLEQLSREKMEGYKRHLESKLDTATEERERFLNQLTKLTEEHHRMQVDYGALRQVQEEREKYEADILATQKNSFEELSKGVLNEQHTKMADALKKLTDPLSESLKNYEERMRLQSGGIAELLSKTVTMHDKLIDQSNILNYKTKAIGSWGEKNFENLLEINNLKVGVDYEKQVFCDGEVTLYPDYVIKNIAGRDLIVDVKTPLETYTKYLNDKNDEVNLKGLVRQIEKFIDDVGRKYTNMANGQSFALLYIPIEGALLEALKYDASLFRYGLTKGVVIVSMGTAFALLHALRQLKWEAEYNMNAKRIAEEAGKLVDKFGDIIGYMAKAHKKAASIIEDLGSAARGIEGGRGSMMSRVKKISEYGARIKVSTNLDSAAEKLQEISGYVEQD